MGRGVGPVTGVIWTPSGSGVYSLATDERLWWFLARTREVDGDAAGVGIAGERGDLAAASRLEVRTAGPTVALWAEGALSESLCSPASDALSEDPLKD